ncbi:hypothetical protein BGW41_004083 [Actinomortierella wolfii]|nr:hypothetical protein BGW41_004083 [Actinomortierella wolfii]
MPQGKIQDTKGSQGTMDSSGSTKRIAAIAGGAAGAAVVAAIAVGFFVFFRRRRARRKHMVAYLKHQQHELEAHHQQVQQCKTLASNIEDQDPALTSARNAAYEHSREGNPFYHPDLGPEYYTGPLATEVTPAAAPSDCYRPSDDTKPTTITSPKSSSPQPAASADLDRFYPSNSSVTTLVGIAKRSLLQYGGVCYTQFVPS